MSKTANAKRLEKEKEIEKLNTLGVGLSRENPVNWVKRKLGAADSYGTSLSAGAKAAGDAVMEKQRKEGSTYGAEAFSKEPRQAMREAAAEERREARGYKAGGMVRRGYGKARGGC